MRERIYLPRAVIADIKQHFAKAIDETVLEFDSAWEDEDVVTGHLGGLLTTRQRRVHVTDDEINGTWSWSLHYRKFRGRGGGATESALGADGIFEFLLEGDRYGRVKSILFQSKMAGSGGHDLVEQCARLSTWREAAFVILYDRDGFKAITLDAALQAKGAVESAQNESLAKFLVDEFIGCKVGDSDLHYIPAMRELRWYSINNQTVAVRFTIPNRFRLKVVPPKGGLHIPNADLRIEAEQIHRHRMKATPEDILKVQYEQAPQTPKQAVRQLSRVYHTDFFTKFSVQTRELLNARLQEFNEARTELERNHSMRRRRQSHGHTDGGTSQEAEKEARSRPGHISSDKR
jgi:hypothetical protein